MTTSLSDLFDDFQSAINNGNIDEAHSIYESILEKYEQQRDDEIQLSARSQMADIESTEDTEKIDKYLGTQMETLAERLRFKTVGGTIVDEYHELQNTGEFQDLWDELQESISELTPLEENIEDEKTTAEQAIKNTTVPADVNILRVDKDTNGTLDTNTTFGVTVVIANVGDKQAQNISLSIDPVGPISAKESNDVIGSVSGRENTKYEYEFEIVGTGNGQIQFELNSVNAGTDQKSITVPISSESNSNNTLRRFDQENTGQISFSDVLGAIDSYNSDKKIGNEEVSFEDVINVIDAYNNNTAV